MLSFLFAGAGALASGIFELTGCEEGTTRSLLSSSREARAERTADRDARKGGGGVRGCFGGASVVLVEDGGTGFMCCCREGCCC